MKLSKEAQDIIKRHDVGYTNTLYGNTFYSSLQRDTDFCRLVEEVKKMSVMGCCVTDSEDKDETQENKEQRKEVFNTEVEQLKEFVDEYIEAWEEGNGGDTELYRKAKNL